jgi:hypothetical protein
MDAIKKIKDGIVKLVDMMDFAIQHDNGEAPEGNSGTFFV